MQLLLPKSMVCGEAKLALLIKEMSALFQPRRGRVSELPLSKAGAKDLLLGAKSRLILKTSSFSPRKGSPKWALLKFCSNSSASPCWNEMGEKINPRLIEEQRFHQPEQLPF